MQREIDRERKRGESEMLAADPFPQIDIVW